jgi:hypothetical protein
MRIVCESCGAVAEAVVRAGPGGAAEVVCGACGAAQALEPTSPDARAEASPAPAVPENFGPLSERSEPDTWAELIGRWQDEQAHRAYLARFCDLPGLTEAGRRYREVLERRPDDPIALRARDEIVKRAAVLALAQLPRTRSPQETPRWVKHALVAVMVLLGLASVVIVLWVISGARGLRIP